MTAAQSATRSEHTRSRGLGWGAALGSLVGWYDFLIFPVVALSYFGPIFFPQQSDDYSRFLLIGIWLLGYLLRPVGALFLGAWGDSGRRTHALAVAVGLSAIGTGVIGLLPTGTEWAVPLLVICRCLTGIGLGGAWSGSMVLAAERSAFGRGGHGALAQIGMPLAMLATLGAVALFVLLPSTTALGWAWRLPFLGSFVFVLVALFIAFFVTDLPVAERPVACAATEVARHPYAAGLVLGIFAAVFGSAITYYHSYFVLHYASNDWILPPLLYLGGMAIAAAASLVGVGIGALLLRRSPAWGVVLIGGVLASGAFVVMLILLALVSINWSCLLFGACFGTLGIAYAGLPTMLADAFTPARRYTGVALVSSLSSVFGGLVPFVIFEMAGSHATYGFVLLTLVLIVVSAMAIFGGMALNMRYPKSSDDVAAVTPEVAEL